MRYNPNDNPYAKQGKDPHGKTCFYIYNDDGSQAVGPSGPRFCYSSDKAEQIIKKVEAAGLRVSPSSVSPGPQEPRAPRPQHPEPGAAPRRGMNPAVDMLMARFEALRPILNHHLVMSNDRPHWGNPVSGKAPKVQGIDVRRKYILIHSGHDKMGRPVPEFVVNMENMEISRADENGQPRDWWNYGTVDEVIARGQTRHPRNNPMTDWV